MSSQQLLQPNFTKSSFFYIFFLTLRGAVYWRTAVKPLRMLLWRLTCSTSAGLRGLSVTAGAVSLISSAYGRDKYNFTSSHRFPNWLPQNVQNYSRLILNKQAKSFLGSQTTNLPIITSYFGLGWFRLLQCDAETSAGKLYEGSFYFITANVTHFTKIRTGPSLMTPAVSVSRSGPPEAELASVFSRAGAAAFCKEKNKSLLNDHLHTWMRVWQSEEQVWPLAWVLGGWRGLWVWGLSGTWLWREAAAMEERSLSGASPATAHRDSYQERPFFTALTLLQSFY